MDTTLTPGPWVIDNEKELAIVGSGTAVAFIPPQHKNAEANSHLIAAAPELLEALIDLEERVKRYQNILRESSINPGKWNMLDTRKASSAIIKALNK